MREGNAHTRDADSENVRYCRAFGYRRDAYDSIKESWSDIEVMEDFHVNLGLLKAGHANIVSFNYSQGQNASQHGGGCDEYRTLDVQAQAAEKLAELHSPFVTVVQKKQKRTEDWWGARKDVRIQWKKAYASSGRT